MGENANNQNKSELFLLGARSAERLRSAGTFPARRSARRIRDDLAALAGVKSAPGAAHEWLFDNRGLIEREALAAAEDFSVRARLRAGRSEALVCEAAAEFVRAAEGRIGSEQAVEFFSGFESVTPLTLRELTLLFAALRGALTARLREEFASAPDAGAVSAAIEGLRALSTADAGEVLDALDLAGRTLAREGCGVYGRMDEPSRAYYRRRLAALAKREGISELECAARVLELTRRHSGDPRRGHCGWWLLCEPMGRAARVRTGRGCALAALLAAAAVAAAAGTISGGLITAALSFLPALELARRGLDALLLRALRPRELPRMALEGGVPDEGRTICAVSALLTGPEDGEKLARRLETFRCASRECGANLAFALLADLPEAASEELETDAPALDAAKRAVDGLNEKYSGGFYLFTRRRAENRRDGVWTARERKRGALMALAGAMAGRDGELICLAGDMGFVRGARFILALDADTTLLPGAARELIGAMLHPLNRPVIDEKRRAVSAGRGIIHPRVSVELAASEATRFARAAAGPGGMDPYGGACGEAWMDLTGRGGFAGKGIIDAAALLRCCSGLPENLVLSHDAVEGALLRGGAMGSTELTDGFPASPAAYFKRQHRWVRGDWQNLAVLWRLRGRIAPADRLHIIDSARRSLSAPAAALAIAAAAFFPAAGLLPAALIAALSLCAGLPGAALRALTRRSGRERHPGSALYGAALALARALLKFIFLPWEAWTNLSAICTAVWRVCVSRRRLLQWQTSAQGLPGGPSALLAAAWPQPLLGAALLLFSPEPAGKTLGVAWAAGLFMAGPLGARLCCAERLTGENRRFLLGECEKVWRYFAGFCTPERGYLPPDNYQEQPPVGLAERTSPTNIGLAITSCLAAADLKLCGSEAALDIIEGIITTCEGLEKWRGHLYNWYGTRTLRPMEPRYVSTVDSGNLAACLTAAAAGLVEYGRPELAGRALKLRDGMDFAALFDRQRRLFRIGFDTANGRADRGCYDLMASEERLTGYYAVAHGDVTARHWRQLSRALVGRDGYRGLASWTGTMFEYLMPELFLPLQRGSLLWESVRFCLYVQRRDVPEGAPWGQSESAFFALDSSMSYRYKANGCAALALRRGMGADTVCAPYASYLALAAAPNAAARNLRRFAAVDAGGRFGLWEAVDYTPRRCAGGRGEVVRSVMAHHLGMSLTAAANCLLDGAFTRRFMSWPDMAAFAPLLAERAPEGAATLRRRAASRPGRAPARRRAACADSGVCAPSSSPRVYPLSNGVYSLLMTANGLSRAQAGAIAAYRGFSDAVDGPAGLRIRFMGADLLPVPGNRAAFRYTCAGGLLRFDGDFGGFASSVTSGVTARATAELRVVEIRAKEPVDARVELSFEPVLARYEDYAAHPAYWRLGLEALEEDGALFIRRLPRPGAPGCWLCAASDAACSLRANADGEPLGALDYPLVTLGARAALEAGGSFRARFAIGFGATKDAAAEAARRCLVSGAALFGDIVSVLGAAWGLGPDELAGVPELASRILFPRCESGEAARAEELWAAGVSGDYPVIAARPCAGMKAACARHAALRSAGVRADLVFITDDAGEYRRDGFESVRRALASLGLEALLGARAGVHAVDSSMARAVLGSAALVLPGGAALPPRRFAAFPSDTPLPEKRAGGGVEYEQADGEFRFTVRGALPPRAWSLPMSNGKFGYIAADCGLGNMFGANARMERVNAWICDERASAGPETLECMCGGERVSLFAAEDGAVCRVRFGHGWAVWEKLGARVTAFVPLDAAARVLVIEGAPGEIYWKTSLQLAAEGRDAPFVYTWLDGGVLRAVNQRSGMEFAAAFSEDAAAFTCDAAAWAARRPGGETGAGLMPCFAAVLPARGRVVIACGSAGAEELRRLARYENAAIELERVKAHFSRLCRVNISTGDALIDGYASNWAVYQALACRMTARTSIYQSGGAYGFRDQLQDAANLLWLDPGLARGRILDCCAHQYEEGDVMHWWHPGRPDSGVRTRVSDDLLWLPWALCEYIDATGDEGILSVQIRGLASPPLAPGEGSRYEAAVPGKESGVLEHAASALRLVMRRGFGPHGLLKMGAGDWCDGFDAVGGESVWLTEFFAHTARRFAKLLPTSSAAALISAARRCEKGAEAAWDGRWYRRGYFEDGRPLGSAESRGCKIDAVAQAWAAFAGLDAERVDTALTSALEYLRDGGGLTRIFTPPFGGGTEYAGYVNGYGEGFRENGGQYTHAAIWLALALIERGRLGQARELLAGLLRRDGNYGAEPFVLAADVYANAARYGEAGWSWYTGSAGWYLRAARALERAEDAKNLQCNAG